MNSLELLQKSAREKFHDAVAPNMTTEHFQFLDTLITHTYETAIKDCLEVLPSVDNGYDNDGLTFNKGFTTGWNKFRSEIKAKLEALLTTTHTEKEI